MQFKAYRVPTRCWRCWKKFEFYSPYEFVDILLFKCEKCNEMRVTQTYAEGHGYARQKFLDLHYPMLRGWGGKKEDRAFLSVFENQWTEACPCSGRFRLRAPIRCPHCHAPELRILRGRGQIVESPPMPVLKFSVPPEYANAPGRPPWQAKGE